MLDIAKRFDSGEGTSTTGIKVLWKRRVYTMFLQNSVVLTAYIPIAKWKKKTFKLSPINIMDFVPSFPFCLHPGRYWYLRVVFVNSG